MLVCPEQAARAKSANAAAAAVVGQCKKLEISATGKTFFPSLRDSFRFTVRLVKLVQFWPNMVGYSAAILQLSFSTCPVEWNELPPRRPTRRLP